jgi:hypothetical protein
VPFFICETCGIQHAESERPPAECAICTDERQYVGHDGQLWTTLEELRKRLRPDIRDLDGLGAIGCEPSFAIGQRALVVDGVLWDCTPLLDGMVEAAGEIRAIAICHPHFHSTMVEWSRALGDVPIYIHEDDRAWVMRPDPAVELWSGEELDLGGGLTLLRLGGHFEGAQVLHSAPRRALFSGDIVTVVADRRWVSFMRSYPNLIPLPATAVQRIADKLEPYEFDRIYGGWWGTVVPEDGKNAVRRSAARYVAALQSSPSQ